MTVKEIGIGSVLIEGCLLRDRLQLFVPVDAAGVLTPGKAVKPVAHAAKPGDQVGTIPAQQVSDGPDPRSLQRRLGGLADAPDDADRFGFEERLGFGPADDGEATRFVEVAGDLGEVFVVAEADGAGEAKLGFHLAGQAGEEDGGGCAVQALGAGQVEEGFVEGERLDGGGEAFHHGPDRAAGLDVGGEAGFDDHGFGTELEGLKHRHGGADAFDPGEVAAGGDDAAGAAADDEGVVAQGGVVALFDAGIEGVAVHVGDGEGGQFGVDGQPGGAAGGAPGSGIEQGEAVAAEAGHVGSIGEARGAAKASALSTRGQRGGGREIKGLGEGLRFF